MLVVVVCLPIHKRAALDLNCSAYSGRKNMAAPMAFRRQLCYSARIFRGISHLVNCLFVKSCNFTKKKPAHCYCLKLWGLHAG